MKYNKRLAITANTSWYIYNFRKDTVIELLRQGYSVDCVVPSGEDEWEEKLKQLGARVVVVPLKQYSYNPISEVISLFCFFILFLVNRYGVVLTFTIKPTIYGVLAAKLTKSKVVVNVAGLGEIYSGGSFFKNIIRKLHCFCLRLADYIFFQNHGDLKIIEESLGRVGAHDVLPGSGVNLKDFTYSQIKNENISNFAFIGRLIIEKGVLFFVEAIESLRGQGYQVTAEIYGIYNSEDPKSVSKDWLESIEKKDGIVFKGESKNVCDSLSSAAWVVLPTFYNEGTPKVLLEAIASGRPILTTNVNGTKKLLSEDFCMEIEEASALGVERAIKRAIDLSIDEVKSLSYKAREVAEQKYNVEIVLRKYISVITMF